MQKYFRPNSVLRQAWNEQGRDSRKRNADSKQKTGRINLPLAGALAVTLVAGYFIGVELWHDGSVCVETCAPTGRPSPLAGMSPTQFDQKLDREEGWTGVMDLRKRLALRAAGHVLEVAVGTGRNLGLYDLDGFLESEKSGAIKSFTGVDISPEMLDVAAKKVLKGLPSSAKSSLPSVSVLRGPDNEVIGGAAEFMHGKIRLVSGNALDALPPPPHFDDTPGSEARYDTVIQTFGLCSVSDPQRLVRNLIQAAKPGTGRVILVEHGQGTWKALNWWLDRYATDHFQKYGCWWNRDIETIIRKAVADLPGVEIVEISRPPKQLETVLWIELGVLPQPHGLPQERRTELMK
jgi:methyltransferase OMS1